MTPQQAYKEWRRALRLDLDCWLNDRPVKPVEENETTYFLTRGPIPWMGTTVKEPEKCK